MGGFAALRTENRERRTERAASAQRMEPLDRGGVFFEKHEGHKGPRRHTKGETADYADWSRLGAGYRRQGCQNGNRRCSVASLGRPSVSHRFEQIKGVLAHAGRAIGSLEVWRLGSLDRPHAARLSQRTRRTTVQARSDKPSKAKGTKGTARRRGRAVRARKAHVRPGGLRGHGGLRTPCFGGGVALPPQRTENRKQRTESARQARDGEAIEKAKPPSL